MAMIRTFLAIFVKKIGGLFLNLGRFYKDENKSEIVIKLFLEA
ncbi:hypothetical protein RAMDARK_0252 [Rickettsia amblyommatis str. Darkwater]|nr:hypothetical protein RAMDARK_0252 [Rickettsia amblyommatis str. Darkwater]